MMQYSVPTNFQPDLVPALAGLPVAELYGQLPRDFVGGGRASVVIGPVGRRQVADHVAQARAAGYGFTYTLNSVSLANREWSISGQRQLAALVDWLVEIGVSSVTVAIPYLLQFIRRRAPALPVAVSTQALVASPEKARRWVDLGASAITLSVLDVQRDFRTLAAIRRAVPARLQLLANLGCLQACPAGTYHAAVNSHASQTGLTPFVVDQCSIDCHRRRLARPEEMIRAGFIRPEDQHHYEAVGIDRLKFVNRGMKTEWVARIVRAYAERRSPANFMDLLPTRDKSLIFTRPPFWHLVRHIFHPHRANLLRLAGLRALREVPEPAIDSAALDGLLDPFLAGRCDSDCETCGHCRAIARRAVRVDETRRQAALAAYDAALESILSGKLFSYR